MLHLASLELLTAHPPFSAKKREGELTVAQGRMKDLESLFHRSEAELASALSDKHGLETDVAELRAQLAKVGLAMLMSCFPVDMEKPRRQPSQVAVPSARLPCVSQAEDGHAVAKKQLEKETLMRVDLENRCQSLQEELGFSKSVFEEVSMHQLDRHPPQLLETTPSTGPPLGVCSSVSCPLQLLMDSLSWVLFGRLCFFVSSGVGGGLM